MDRDPILITGCARSGTSMVAGCIHLCGAFGGNMSGPNSNNKKGMFENARIRNTICKPYLTTHGVDKLGQFPLPTTSKLTIPVDFRSKVERVFLEEGYTSGPYFYKGAKSCLFWPVWHFAFPNAKWVIVRRKSADIANSCVRTGFMKAFANTRNCRVVGAADEREGWLWWVNQHLDRFREMMDAGLQIKIVWPERMVDGDYTQLRETIEWLGLEWRPQEVMNFIEPQLWKARNTKGDR